MLDIDHPHFADVEPLLVFMRRADWQNLNAGAYDALATSLLGRVQRQLWLMAVLSGAGLFGVFDNITTTTSSPVAFLVVQSLCAIVLVCLSWLAFRQHGAILRAILRLHEVAPSGVQQ